MNILQQIKFSNEKPNVAVIKKNDSISYFAVALGEGAVLKKHTTAFPATLVVAKGKINFKIKGEEILLNEFDVFEIPINVEHEVVGIQENNLFLITQQL